MILQSRRDLGSLRIFDPRHPERAVVAAGAPWFMALFGRDSLLTALMALPLDPTLALGTLRTLAELQGTRVDTSSEEQPGRILHEVRLGATTNLALGGSSVYYGTADATRCSSSYSASSLAGGACQTMRTTSSRPPTARSNGSNTTAIATATDSSSTRDSTNTV